LSSLCIWWYYWSTITRACTWSCWGWKGRWICADLPKLHDEKQEPLGSWVFSLNESTQLKLAILKEPNLLTLLCVCLPLQLWEPWDTLCLQLLIIYLNYITPCYRNHSLFEGKGVGPLARAVSHLDSLQTGIHLASYFSFMWTDSHCKQWPQWCKMIHVCNGILQVSSGRLIQI
jgi:hypothetical protein